MSGTAPGTYLATLADELAQSPAERELLAFATDLLAYAAVPAAPEASLRARVLGRLDPAPLPPTFEAHGFYFARADALDWTTIAPGVRIKWLFQDPATGERTGLIEMDPDTPFPGHPHHAVEDLYLISGEAWVGDVAMRAGDYCRSPGGTRHDDVRSGAAGALSLFVSR